MPSVPTRQEIKRSGKHPRFENTQEESGGEETGVAVYYTLTDRDNTEHEHAERNWRSQQ